MAVSAMKEILLLLKANDQITDALVKVKKQLLETKQLSKDLLNTPENQKRIKQLEGMQNTYYNQMKNNLKVIGEKKKELSKQEKEDLKTENQLIKENAKAEKQAVEEIKKANQEKHKQEKDYQNQRKRDAQDLNKWIEQERRATNQAYEEKKRQEKELQRLAEQRLKIIKDIGVAMTKTGTAMIGAGVAGFTTASSLGQKYVNNFVEPDRMLAIKSSELNGLSINTFNKGMIELAKRTGMSSKGIGDIMAISSNASSVGNSVRNLETMAKVGYITGASGESLGTASAIFNNRLKNNGWRDIEEFGDALIAFSDLGGASQSSMIQKYTELSNYTGAFDKYDPFTSFKALAAVSKMLPGEEGLSIATTGLRQLLGVDVIKKDPGAVVATMASARNMTMDEYAKKIAGVNLNGNKLESQDDLYKLGADYIPLVVKTFMDAMSIEGTALVKNKKGKTEKEIRAKELTMDLTKDLSGNTRSLSAINALNEAIDNGVWADVNEKLSKTGIEGRLNKAVQDFNKSDTGKLMMAQTNIKENGMMLLARLAPLLAGVLQKLVEWTDSLAGVDFETLVEEGERLGEIFKTLIQLGIGLFIIGKVTTMFSVLISTVDHTMGILGNFGLSTSTLTTKLGRYWSSAMTNWSLGLNGGLKSFSLLAGTATTTAGKMAILGVELAALVGAVVWCYNAIKNLADDFETFGKSKEYLQGREDAYNKKDTASADAYNKMNSTALGKFFDDFSNGNYLGAAGDLLSAFSPTNLLGGGVSALLTYGSTLQGQEGLNFFQEMLAKGYTNYETLASWAEGKDNKVLDAFLSTISPDYGAYNKNQDKIEDVYNEHQGNYVEEGLKDAESYFDKKESWDDILKQFEEDSFSTDVPFESLINPDAQDVYDAMEEGAKDGTEKGIKNALSGDYNIPGSYTKLSQNGLAELVGFDNFGVKRTGNTVTMKNDININITADGQNADVIASIVEQRLSEFFRGSTLLDL